MDHRIIVVVRQIVRRDQPKGDETDPAKPGGALRDTFESAAAAMANALDKHCNLLVKMTSPRWGKKRSAQRIVANAEFYHVAARRTH